MGAGVACKALQLAHAGLLAMLAMRLPACGSPLPCTLPLSFASRLSGGALVSLLPPPLCRTRKWPRRRASRMQGP